MIDAHNPLYVVCAVHGLFLLKNTEMHRCVDSFFATVVIIVCDRERERDMREREAQCAQSQ